MPDLFTPPPRPPKSYRPGQRTEHAGDTRDASYRQHNASGKAATKRERLLAVYAEYVPRVQRQHGHGGLTDREAAECYEHKHGEPLPRTSVNGRRGELVKDEAGPLVERVENRLCLSKEATEIRAAGGRSIAVSTWRITARGREALAQSGAIK